MEEAIRVLLVDDSVPFRVGLRKALEPAPEIVVVGEAEDGKTALWLIESLQPDVLMLDCRMPGMDGVQVAVTIQKMCLPTNILAYSAYDDEDCVRGMLGAGAVGYLLKDESPEKIVEAIRAVADGKGWFSPAIAARVAQWLREKSGSAKLTERELAVLRLLARGKGNKQISDELCITERTVRFHVQNIYDKIGVHSRAEAAVWAVQHNIVGKE